MTERYNAAIIDHGPWLDDIRQAKGILQLTLTKSASSEELINSVVVDEPDIVLLDDEAPGKSIWELAKRLRQVSPTIPILLLSKDPDWSLLEHDTFIDMVRSPYEPLEVVQRILRLVHGASKDHSPRPFRLPSLVVDELRNENGRIDAKKVAEMFGISIPVLARIIEAGEPAIYKTPDARSIQPKLIEFEQIACGLLKLTGSVRGLRIWLNAANPELDKDLPIDFIKDGHVEDIAAMVEDALLGHPG